MPSGKENTLGVLPLAALVVGAMIGGGIFSLPQNMAQNASACAVIIAWIVTGTGIFFLANTFRILSAARPDATTGIYAYSKLGFGKFAGFQMAWAYWLSNIFGNVGYAVLLMDALDYFFPGVFTGGNNLWSIIGGSVVIWIMNFCVLRGVKQAAFLNTAGTIFKLVPILLFILIMLWVFNWNTFTDDFTGKLTISALGLKPLGSLTEQVRSTMLVTLWAFIGIEGAVVMSARARSQKDVGYATILGFAGCLVIYAALSILPFGRMDQHQLAQLANPSTAPLLASAVHGKWGGVVMNLGVIVALLTSWLAFTIMVVQIPFAAANDGTFPAIFKRENPAGAPTVSLWVTSLVMQLAMAMVYFSNNAWNTMLSVTSVMVLPPYLGCTLYLWKSAAKADFPAIPGAGRVFSLICGVAGSLYAVWMIYAGGVKYLMMAFIFQLIGIPVYISARRKDNPDGEIMTPAERTAAWIITIVALIAVIVLFSHKK